jgi:hypothetical protein
VDLKVKHPEALNQYVDSQIEELLRAPPTEIQKAQLLAWKERLLYSMAGSFALMINGTICGIMAGLPTRKPALSF